MLAEALNYLTLDGPAYCRQMGFAGEIVAIRARYGRCRKHWAPHLAASRQAILKSVDACETRDRVVVMGAGWLLDVPLRELSEAFREVVLLDLMRPAATRLRLALGHYRNVRFITHDVTGIMANLRDKVEGARQHRTALDLTPLHSGGPPALPGPAADADLTLSVNLLSQLPVVPRHYIEKRLPSGLQPPEPELENFLRALVEGHVAMLGALRGRRTMICDYSETIHQPGSPPEVHSAVEDVDLPAPSGGWDWHVAPPGELDDGVSIVNQVGVVTDDAFPLRSRPSDKR